MPRYPRSNSLRKLSTSWATTRAETAMTPSTDRSNPPARMTKVMPTATTIVTEAASAMFWRFPTLAKRGLMKEKATKSRTSAASGPQASRRTDDRFQRVRRTGRPSAAATPAGSSVVARAVGSVA